MTGTLIEAKAAAGAANEGLVLAALAAAGDAGIVPSEMATRTSLPDRTWRNVVTRLIDKNLVRREGQRGRIYITGAGRSEAGGHLAGVALAGSLGQAVGHFPTEGHRALLRLLLSGVIARHHLRSTLTRSWGSFVVVGPTKAGKTALADFVTRAFGLPITSSIRQAPAMTPGAVWGRTDNRGGQWTFYPSPILGQPFVCIDEVDKAAPETFASIMRLVQGDAEVAGEQGVVAAVAPTTLLCGNGRVADVRPEYRRRSVVLDLWQHEALLEDVPPAMRTLFAEGVIPRLDLDGYHPPVTLAADVAAEVSRIVKASLTTEGWREFDELALERMVLGRCSLVADQRMAALATTHDYLTCAATIGHVAAVPDSLREALGGSAIPLGPDVEAAVRESGEPVRRAAKRLEDEIEFHRVQGGLVQKLAGWFGALDGRRIPDADKEAAAALRKVIGLLRDRAGRQTTLAGLTEILRHARPEVVKAQELLNRIDQTRTEAERAKTRAHDANAFAAEQERLRKSAIAKAKQQAGHRLAEVRRDIGTLEKFYKRSATKPSERADGALASLRLSGGVPVVLFEEGAGGKAPASRFLQRYAPPPDVWSARFDPTVRFPATGSECPALARWGAETQRVLGPALRYLYGEEDRLTAAAGRQPRSRTRLAV